MPSLPSESTLFGVLVCLFPVIPVLWLMFESQDLSICADLLLQGVLCAQFAHYTGVNQRDSVLMKLFVAGLALLTTLKTAQVLCASVLLWELCFNLLLRAITWIQNAALFENLEAVHSLSNIKWLTQTNLILEACMAFYVQIFFCHRLWVGIFCIPGHTLFAQSVPRHYLTTYTLWSSP
jgi:hypothetical protein